MVLLRDAQPVRVSGADEPSLLTSPGEAAPLSLLGPALPKKVSPQLQVGSRARETLPGSYSQPSALRKG